MSARIFSGSAIAELGLQFCDDLAEGALAVAALEYLAACTLQLIAPSGNRTMRSSCRAAFRPQRHPVARRG